MNLSNSPVWNDLDKITEQIDLDAVFKQHLEDCNYKISGYWNGDDFYEEISFTSPLYSELASVSISLIKEGNDKKHRIKLKFLLRTAISNNEGTAVSDFETRVGELVLIFNSNLEFLDENWLINIKSPFVIARRS
ncbi:hypothetical protein LC608_19030 [Nostoc sp. XA010]|uniref:hypothetical protein n=1 Tax=Nostoc sp. XA010 TaxID=2780407 RepID=UPI001E4B9031|nr:hypothetical protein [Nostoc sp. XA010]MCC5659030.1 hypothetical protein [Nostoc sp. XA010]